MTLGETWLPGPFLAAGGQNHMLTRDGSINSVLHEVLPSLP
ncbi:hypothetical protein ABIB25_003688 [Nakamurella sp. UYEF19]